MVTIEIEPHIKVATISFKTGVKYRVKFHLCKNKYSSHKKLTNDRGSHSGSFHLVTTRCLGSVHSVNWASQTLKIILTFPCVIQWRGVARMRCRQLPGQKTRMSRVMCWSWCEQRGSYPIKEFGAYFLLFYSTHMYFIIYQCIYLFIYVY